jgi:hypothetical protein
MERRVAFGQAEAGGLIGWRRGKGADDIESEPAVVDV